MEWILVVSVLIHYVGRLVWAGPKVISFVLRWRQYFIVPPAPCETEEEGGTFFRALDMDLKPWFGSKALGLDLKPRV